MVSLLILVKVSLCEQDSIVHLRYCPGAVFEVSGVEATLQFVSEIDTSSSIGELRRKRLA